MYMAHEKDLVEIRQEYTIHLVNILTPNVYEGVRSLYETAKQIHDNFSKVGKKCPGKLKIFQNMMLSVPKWNKNMIDNETNRIRTRIYEENGLDWFDDLIRAVVKSNIELLTHCKDKHDKQKYHEKIEITDFIHKCYIQCAKCIYNNPYLFWDEDLEPFDLKRNQRDACLLIKEAICEAIRRMLPVKYILQRYLGNDYREEEDNSKDFEGSISEVQSNNLKEMVMKDLGKRKKHEYMPTSESSAYKVKKELIEEKKEPSNNNAQTSIGAPVLVGGDDKKEVVEKKDTAEKKELNEKKEVAENKSNETANKEVENKVKVEEKMNTDKAPVDNVSKTIIPPNAPQKTQESKGTPPSLVMKGGKKYDDLLEVSESETETERNKHDKKHSNRKHHDKKHHDNKHHDKKQRDNKHHDNKHDMKKQSGSGKDNRKMDTREISKQTEEDIYNLLEMSSVPTKLTKTQDKDLRSESVSFNVNDSVTVNDIEVYSNAGLYQNKKKNKSEHGSSKHKSDEKHRSSGHKSGHRSRHSRSSGGHKHDSKKSSKRRTSAESPGIMADSSRSKESRVIPNYVDI